MSTISQKDSVVNEVKSILGVSYDASVPAREQLSDENLKLIKTNVIAGIVDGSIDFKKETTDVKEITRYVSGMVSNHLRKTKELNGGRKYNPQSTGRGSRDLQISELNKLLKTYSESTSEYGDIVQAINTRKETLASERAEIAKAKKKQNDLSSIDVDALPEGLKHLANSLVNEINAQ